MDSSLHPGRKLHGFEVEAVTDAPSLRLVAVRLRHCGTGARLLHLRAADRENLVAIGFLTPPPDHTGMPHILEHSVVSGSRRFPVRDLFGELRRRSMATFINAMTAWDSTFYPVASKVPRDLFNLVDVYFDAVFHPLLSEQTFKREGHHLAPVDPEDPTAGVRISGIVYNEMKSNFSRPETKLYRLATRLPFPETCYSRESGGHPAHIPDLTYEAFLEFHRTFYHPSNAFIFVYGDIPTEEYLQFFEPRLGEFERREVHVEIAEQPRWSQPREHFDSYPVDAGASLAQKTFLMLVWLVSDATDPRDTLANEILARILVGNEAAPLRKALIDSGLGQALAYSGHVAPGRQGLFIADLKGSEPEHKEAFVSLVLGELERLAGECFAEERVEAAFQQVAYEYLEIRPLYPFLLLLRVMRCWLYGGDPLCYLRMDEHVAALRRAYEANPRLFNEMIRERLVENPHRLTLVLAPDPDLAAREEEAFARRMAAVRERLGPEALQAVAEEAVALVRAGAEPNPPELVARLPRVGIADLPPSPEHVPWTVEKLHGVIPFVRAEVFSNGINYLHFAFDLSGLPEELWPDLPRYMDAVRKMGVAGAGYERVAARIAANTGGLRWRTWLESRADDAGGRCWYARLMVKVMDERLDEALDLLRELLLHLDPGDRGRLRDVLLQAQADYRTRFLRDAARTALLQAGRHLFVENRLRRMTFGLPQLERVNPLLAGFEEQAEELIERIRTIQRHLLHRRRFSVGFTGSDAACRRVMEAVASWAGEMADGPATPATFDPPEEAPPREGLAAAIQVAYCAMALPAPHYSHPDAPLLAVGARLLDQDHLTREIRLKGNAYMAWCDYDPLGRFVHMGSYADPHVLRTVRLFEELPEFIRQAEWTRSELEPMIIGTAKRFNRPIRPEAATGFAHREYLSGRTRELREEEYRRILAATPEEVKRAWLELLETQGPRAGICVISGRRPLDEANRRLERPLRIDSFPI
jgi:hypothetical protein